MNLKIIKTPEDHYRVPKSLMDNPRLRGIDAAIYCYLYDKAYFLEPNNDGYAITNEELSNKFGVSLNTISRSFRKLKKEKVLKTTETRFPFKGQLSTVRRIKFLIQPQ